MEPKELEHQLARLVRLGGILRDLKDAKTTIHNTERSFDHAKVEDYVQDFVMTEIERRIEAADDEVKGIQAEVSGALREATTDRKRADVSSLQHGDIIDVVSGTGVRDYLGVTYTDSDQWLNEGFTDKSGRFKRFLATDEIYLVERPKKELPTEDGSWIQVTGYDGTIEAPFNASLNPWAGWLKPDRNLGAQEVDPDLITEFHELELARKEAA